MNLPPEFISNIQNTFQERGYTFLNMLPDMIEEASARWSLTDIQPSSNLSYNFVAFAKRPSTTPLHGSAQDEVVLKMGVPESEMRSEMAALRLFNGEGACKLIDYDEEKYWILLERLKPGMMLSTLEDDEEATNIAADLMQKIWRSPALAPGASVDYGATNMLLRSARDNFIQLTDWFDGLKKLREMFNGGTGPLNEKLVDRVERSVKDFLIENHKPVLMHGDFHHFNILSSERGWVVIDPKGVIGPACYEVGPLLINPWGDLLRGNNYRLMTKRRIDILHERLGFERERIREWGLAHAILSAWWSIEDNGDWEYSMQCGELFASL